MESVKSFLNKVQNLPKGWRWLIFFGVSLASMMLLSRLLIDRSDNIEAAHGTQQVWVISAFVVSLIYYLVFPRKKRGTPS